MLSIAQCSDALGEVMPNCQQFELWSMRVGGWADERQSGARLARLWPHVAERPDARMSIETTECGEAMLAIGRPDDDRVVLAPHELGMAFRETQGWSTASVIGGGMVVGIRAGVG